METYLLIWKSTKTPRSEKNYWQKLAKKIIANGYVDSAWSTGRTKKILPNDRLFLVRLGEEPRGIFASGWAVSNVYQEPHWDEQERAKRKITGTVDLYYDAVRDPNRDTVLTISKLRAAVSNNQEWQPQGSAIGIEHQVALKLEKEWAKLIGFSSISPAAEMLPNEIDSKESTEGAKKKVIVNRYERDPKLRRACIKEYGLTCSVCKFNFEDMYGYIGHGFIQVHHLTPISSKGKSYKVNSKKAGLRLVGWVSCPLKVYF